MPAVQMFGRRWALAADDVPVLALPAAIFHGIWFIFLVIGFSAIQRPSACAKTPSYEICIIGLFVCFFLSCVLEGWLVREGLKGGIFEVEKRKRVVPLLYAQIVVATAEVAFLVLGTVLIFQKRPRCYEEGFTLWHSQGVVDVIVWTTWGVVIFMAAVVFVTYNLFPQYNSKASWERRCRVLSFCLCCSTRMAGNTGGPGIQANQPDPVGRMAELFAQVYEHVEPSQNVLAGAANKQQ